MEIYVYILNQKLTEYGLYKLNNNYMPTKAECNQGLVKLFSHHLFDTNYQSTDGTINQNLRLLNALNTELSHQANISLSQCKCIGRITKKKVTQLYYIAIIDSNDEFINFEYLTKVDENTKESKMAKKLFKKFNKHLELGKRQALRNAILAQIHRADILFFIFELVLFTMSLTLILIEKNKGISLNENCQTESLKTIGVLVLSVAVLLFGKIEKIIMNIIKGSNFKRNCRALNQADGFDKETIIKKMATNQTANYQDFVPMNFVINNNIVETFFYSHKENENLRKYGPNLKVNLVKEKSKLSSYSQMALAYVVSDRLEKYKTIFNGKLLGLDSELNFAKVNQINIKKVRYHHYVAIDDMVFRNLTSELDPTYYLSGTKLTLNPITGGFRDISKSALTNLIGINLIVELKLNNKVYYIINQQSMYNDVNNSLFVPTSSGSLEQSDYKKFQKLGLTSFEDLLKYGMLRELKEECYLDVDLNEGEFSLLGVSRLASKAGKPDFFAKLSLNINDSSLISKIVTNYDEMQNLYVGTINHELETTRLIIIEQDCFLDDLLFPVNNASLQLMYIRYLLKKVKSQ